MDEELYRRGAHLLSLVDRVGRSYADAFLKEKGVSRGQVPYLMELYHHDGVSQDFLAQKAAMDKSTAARAIQKLEAAGLVRREQNPRTNGKIWSTSPKPDGRSIPMSSS